MVSGDNKMLGGCMLCRLYFRQMLRTQVSKLTLYAALGRDIKTCFSIDPAFWAKYPECFCNKTKSQETRSICCTKGHSRHILYLWYQVISRFLARAFTTNENCRLHQNGDP